MKQLDTHTFNDIIGCSPGHFGAGVFVGSTSARMFRCDSLPILGDKPNQRIPACATNRMSVNAALSGMDWGSKLRMEWFC
ncbi:hypothetical protein PQQ99_32235 [Paraburkholderia sediminicola]|uniref:hypothetical protein n=1 Tax=Paraburkholderia sediminicola TaxID=458836 RepID=UPI0038BC535D